MLVPTRHGQYDPKEKYRYGFNGKEMDDELKGSEGNNYDFGARMYDPRVGRWFTRDPLEIKYPNQSGYVGFNNDPIYFKDPDGKDGIASVKGQGTSKKDPIIVTVTANYYYKAATDTQKALMGEVKTNLASPKSYQTEDGKYYKVIIDVSFIKSDDPVESAKKDIGVNNSNYGNVLEIGNGSGKKGEWGGAKDDTINVYDNLITSGANQFNDDNKEESYGNMFKNVLTEEVLHNIGGLHQDGDALPPKTKYEPGSKEMTVQETPASKNRYTEKNAMAIVNRIDKPLGTDALPNEKDKDGVDLRDDAGTAGQVKTDSKPVIK